MKALPFDWRILPLGLLFALVATTPILFDQASVRPVDPAASSLRAPLSKVFVLHPTGARALVVEDLQREDDRTWRYTRRGREQVIATEGIESYSQRTYLLGTDRVGRDVAVLVIRGARTSLAIGLLSAVLAFVVGTAVGGLSAVAPRWLDTVLMRLLEAVLAFPQLVLVLLLAVLFKPSPWTVVLIVGLTSWMGIARMVRAEILQLRGADFVQSARAIGATPARILVRHLLPNALGPALIATTLLVGDAILVESALSFLGLGTGGETPTWGRLVAEGRGDLLRAWWISAFPGLAITLTVLLTHHCGSWLARSAGIGAFDNPVEP